MKTDILIIGAGLTGLLLTHKLKKKGVSLKVIEARNRIGGRIHTINSQQQTPIEMGATWLGKQHKELMHTLEDLDISVFEQYMKGIALFEPLSTAPPQQIELPSNQEASYRIQGGTSTLIDTLANSLESNELILNKKIVSISYNKQNQFTVRSDNHEEFESKYVISTLPPFLLINSIQFDPQLPESVNAIASKTHTWMEDSIKFGISYQNPFWKEMNYSGTIFSNVGPITELYDHSSYENDKYALKGFLQSGLYLLPKEKRKEKVLFQLEKLFGKVAKNYLAYEELLWTNEIYTSYPKEQYILPHQNNGHQIYQNGFFDDHFYIAGTETSPLYGGYMEGAVLSANFIYQKLKYIL